MIGWAYDHLGVYSWVPEMGSLVPFCDYDENGRVSQMEQLKWNDEEMEGRVFIDWEPFDHPQLGRVEIGGFTRKLYNSETRTYTNVLCTPGPKYFDFLDKHAQWNLYLASMSPLVRIVDIKIDKGDAGYIKVTAEVQNLGYLPTNVSQHALDNQTAKPVRVYLELEGASLFAGKEKVELGYLPGTTPRSISPVRTVEWVVKTTRGNAKVVVKAVSEKGGTHSLTRELRQR